MKSTIKSVTMATIVVHILSASLTSFAQTSRFALSINSLTTNFNYGKSNSAMQSYKKNYSGLQFGASYQAGITPMLSIVPELSFAIKGGTLTAKNPITINKSTLRLSTLDLPVLARIHFGQLYLNAGPYASYVLAARLKTDGFETFPGTKVWLPLGEDGIRRWDYGFQAGAGYDFKLRKATLALDARYGYGMANLSKDVERYNRVFNLSLVVRKAGK